MKHILIVDDSATSRLLFRAHFPPDADYILHEAEDADSAIQMASVSSPDIVVLDYNLPDADGIEIARLLIDEGLQAKFVLFTANLQKAVTDAASKAGFVSVLEKPITREKIDDLLLVTR